MDLLALWLQYGFYLENNEKRISNTIDFTEGCYTVTDEFTGLTWQKAGSTSLMNWYQTTDYVTRLNRQGFADFSDWRIPTLKELGLSLPRHS